MRARKRERERGEMKENNGKIFSVIKQFKEYVSSYVEVVYYLNDILQIKTVNGPNHQNIGRGHLFNQ